MYGRLVPHSTLGSQFAQFSVDSDVDHNHAWLAEEGNTDMTYVGNGASAIPGFFLHPRD